MGDMYKGTTDVDGAHYSVMEEQCGDRRPFKAHLDVGLVRTTTGNRVFGAMKGASDGGLHIPHKEKRFPGSHVSKAEIVTNKRGKVVDQEKSRQTYDPKEHRVHIFGGHVETYYNKLKKESAQKFNKQFSQWEKAHKGMKFEELYKAVHAAIRADPKRAAKSNAKAVRKVVDDKN